MAPITTRFSVKKAYDSIIPQPAALNFRGKPWFLAISGSGEHAYTVAEGPSTDAIHASIRAMHKAGVL